jgi:tetratricopeptide (TPR) repeat protein
LVHLWAVAPLPFVATLAMDSQQYDRWAKTIAAGEWLGKEVFFQAPLYPYLLAVVYRLTGTDLNAVYLLQIVCALAGIYALYRAGRLLGGEETGLAAAFLAAVYGPSIFYDVLLLKESLAVAVTCALLWALVAARASGGEARSESEQHAAAALRRPLRWLRWLGAGALLGVLALLRENALLLAPLLLPLAWKVDDRWRGFVRRGAAFAAGLVLTLTPVALRNGIVGGSYLPTTFQGGVNFYIGNNALADGTYRPLVPGRQIPELERRDPGRLAERALGRRLSSGEVSSYWLGQALSWSRAHPGDFLRLQLRKLGMYWSWYEWPDAVDYYFFQKVSPVLGFPLLEYGGACLLGLAGLVVVRKRLAAWAPAWVFGLAWMAATVGFFLFARYRLPGVPSLLLLGGAALAATLRGLRSRCWTVAIPLSLVVLAAFALPHLAGFAPREDLLHYNLGRLYVEQGEPEKAAEEYAHALAANPNDFLAALNLGSFWARRGDYIQARRFFERAEQLAPESDDVQSNLGGIALAEGKPEEAERRFDRALALNAENLAALHNKAVLRARAGDLAEARRLNAELLRLEPGNEAALRLRQRLAG